MIRPSIVIIFLIKFDDESSKSAKGKEHCFTNKGMTSTIGGRLALMKNRLAAVRAGQSYEYCLREETQRKVSAVKRRKVKLFIILD